MFDRQDRFPAIKPRCTPAPLASNEDMSISTVRVSAKKYWLELPLFRHGGSECCDFHVSKDLAGLSRVRADPIDRDLECMLEPTTLRNQSSSSLVNQCHRSAEHRRCSLRFADHLRPPLQRRRSGKERVGAYQRRPRRRCEHTRLWWMRWATHLRRSGRCGPRARKQRW